jgi:hypothetical protein
MMLRRLYSASPLAGGITAFAFALAALWAVLVLLLGEPISWVGACIVSLLIGAAAFDRARCKGQTAPQRFLAQQRLAVRVVFSFLSGVLLLWAIPLLLGMERLPWLVVLGTAALGAVHGEFARSDQAQQRAGKLIRWSRQDKLMLGLSTVALVIYSVALVKWGLPASGREWLAMGFVYAFPVAMLLWVFLRARAERARSPDFPHHPPAI